MKQETGWRPRKGAARGPSEAPQGRARWCLRSGVQGCGLGPCIWQRFLRGKQSGGLPKWCRGHVSRTGEGPEGQGEGEVRAALRKLERGLAGRSDGERIRAYGYAHTSSSLRLQLLHVNGRNLVIVVVDATQVDATKMSSVSELSL